jgi:hypothetical protein
MRLIWTFLLVVKIGFFATADGDLYAQRPTEYEVKAAFLYNFAKFVEWPTSYFTDSSEAVVIGILGKYPFGSDLEKTIQGKTVRGRRLIIKRFNRLQTYQDCHILFISSSEDRYLKFIFDKLKNRPVLSIGEMDGFLENGGIINFMMQENKVRFQINIDAARDAGLKISSRLIRVSINVEGGNR